MSWGLWIIATCGKYPKSTQCVTGQTVLTRQACLRPLSPWLRSGEWTLERTGTGHHQESQMARAPSENVHVADIWLANWALHCWSSGRRKQTSSDTFAVQGHVYFHVFKLRTACHEGNKCLQGHFNYSNCVYWIMDRQIDSKLGMLVLAMHNEYSLTRIIWGSLIWTFSN